MTLFIKSFLIKGSVLKHRLINQENVTGCSEIQVFRSGRCRNLTIVQDDNNNSIQQAPQKPQDDETSPVVEVDLLDNNNSIQQVLQKPQDKTKSKDINEVSFYTQQYKAIFGSAFSFLLLIIIRSSCYPFLIERARKQKNTQ